MGHRAVETQPGGQPIARAGGRTEVGLARPPKTSSRAPTENEKRFSARTSSDTKAEPRVRVVLAEVVAVDAVVDHLRAVMEAGVEPELLPTAHARPGMLSSMWRLVK